MFIADKYMINLSAVNVHAPCTITARQIYHVFIGDKRVCAIIKKTKFVAASVRLIFSYIEWEILGLNEYKAL